MTNPKPCPSWCEHYNNPKNTTGPISDRHSKSCPNAEAPKVEIVDLMGALKRSLDQHPNARPAPEPKQGDAVDFEVTTTLLAQRAIREDYEREIAAIRARLAEVEAERDQYREILESKDEHIANLNGMRDSLRAEVLELKRDAARHEEEEAANCPEDQSCIETIKALRAQLAEKEERERMVDAAISVLSLSNTDKTLAANHLPNTNPYWTPAQDDVARAIRREMRERTARERAEGLLPDLLAIIKQPSRHGLNWAAVDQSEAILAARRDKEGEKR